MGEESPGAAGVAAFRDSRAIPDNQIDFRKSIDVPKLALHDDRIGAPFVGFRNRGEQV
jgi:hypothetical protein